MPVVFYGNSSPRGVEEFASGQQLGRVKRLLGGTPRPSGAGAVRNLQGNRWNQSSERMPAKREAARAPASIWKQVGLLPPPDPAPAGDGSFAPRLDTRDWFGRSAGRTQRCRSER